MIFREEEQAQIEDLISKIKHVESVIGHDLARKSCIRSLKKMKLTSEQKDYILDKLGYSHANGDRPADPKPVQAE